MDHVSQLLRGAVDLHIHAAPSLTPRSVDAWEALTQAAAAGMRGVLLKDHHGSTAPLAALVNRQAGIFGCRLFGSVCLNHAVGGIQPAAADAAIRFGASLVCLPTLSAANHHDYLNRFAPAAGTAASRAPVSGEAPIRLLDADGNLTPPVRAVIDRVAASDAILATGHASPDEIRAVMRHAAHAGCRRILLTHFPAYTTRDLHELGSMADLGPCFVELCLEMTVRDLPETCRFSHAQIAEYIRFFGPDRVVLSTDYGHARLPAPVEGLRSWIGELIGQGFRDEEIRTMTARNPARLLGLEPDTE